MQVFSPIWIPARSGQCKPTRTQNQWWKQKSLDQKKRTIILSFLFNLWLHVRDVERELIYHAACGTARLPGRWQHFWRCRCTSPGVPLPALQCGRRDCALSWTQRSSRTWLPAGSLQNRLAWPSLQTLPLLVTGWQSGCQVHLKGEEEDDSLKCSRNHIKQCSYSSGY